MILDDCAKSRHSLISLVISAPNASGVLPTGSTPSRLRRSANAGERTAFWTAVASFSMIGLGVAAGAIMPIHKMPS